MPQLSFRWPYEESYATEDFLVSDSNATATKFVDHWPEGGNSSAALLCGPEACGKTHLARRWQERTGAGFIDAGRLGTVSSGALWKNARAAVLEDIHAISKEPALFHLMRHAEAHGLSLLMTSRIPAKRLPFELPDLRSRLFALPEVRIEAPDEALLSGYLLKCFADRQWRVDEDVTHWLVARMERSFAAARELVGLLGEGVAQAKKEITIPFVKSLLEQE